MTGSRPEPPRLALTEQTRAFVADVLVRAHGRGREVASRADWLTTLLLAEHPYLSSHLVRAISTKPTLRALTATVDALARAGEPWLVQASAQFVTHEVEPIARELGHGYVGTEHVLFAVTRAPALIGDALQRAGLTWERARAAFDAIEWGQPPGQG